MNKSQRKPYLILNEVRLPNGNRPVLCSFCRYAEWDGSCKEADCTCRHPLDVIRDKDVFSEDMFFGGDCWGFRPDVSPDTAIDMVAQWLQSKDTIITPDLMCYKPRKKVIA